ncbi:MAG TPA: DUF4145 domain-containing protein [Bryobacteraceae bacterium]|jgi:hypothetical protein
MDMQAVTLPQEGLFSLRGSCPHCRADAGFLIVPTASGQNIKAVNMGGNGTSQWAWAIMQCQSCLKYILGNVHRQSNGSWSYSTHYPVGAPDDTVAPEVPKEIAYDFKEALRCRWLNCFRATLIMCRRSIESSCINLGAKTGRLIEKIDYLRETGKITEPLKDLAHQVRLEGNQGAHGDPEGDADSERCDAVIAFAREFFHHVYVMPSKLEKIKIASTNTAP